MSRMFASGSVNCQRCGQAITDDTPAFAVGSIWKHYACSGIHLDAVIYRAYMDYRRGQITQEALTRIVRERKAP